MQCLCGLNFRGPKKRDKSEEFTVSLPSPNPRRKERLEQTKRKGPRLPTELYRLIFSFLPPGTRLRPLLYVNLLFHAEAERLLYHRISFTGQWMGYVGGSRSTHPDARLKLFSQLASTPRLAHMVQSLELYPFINKSPGWDHSSLRGPYWSNLHLALREMSNLKEFTMGTFAEDSLAMEGLEAQRIGVVFAGCTFRLRKLVLLHGEQQDLSIIEKEQLGSGVEELGISWGLGQTHDLKHIFPRLTILEAVSRDKYHPQFVAPSYGVKALAFRSPWDPYWLPPFLPSVPYSDLRSLKVEGWGSAPWRFVGTIFPSLRFLRIRLAHGLKDDDVRQATEHLAALVHLRKISFRGKHLLAHNTSLHSQQIAALLFAHHPRLDSVCLGTAEWRRASASLGTGMATFCDYPDEWKSREWWD